MPMQLLVTSSPPLLQLLVQCSSCCMTKTFMLWTAQGEVKRVGVGERGMGESAEVPFQHPLVICRA